MIRSSAEVDSALNEGLPIVALETTIVAHGMPIPTNLETALAVEANIRAGGAVPASIGIIEGEIICGLSESQLDFLAHSKDVIKAQERDFANAIRTGRSGAVTVGASLLIAAKCGIEVLVTGGIGGVSPDFGSTFDISADLLSIGRYPCITVATGTKAFMDTAASLEYFETHGVPVAVWQSNVFPWFYSTDSGQLVEWRVDTAAEISEAFRINQTLRDDQGIFLAVPIPEIDALPSEQTRAAIAEGLRRMQKNGISGKAATPYLLAALFEITNGASLAANVSLIKNNAVVGSSIAVALASK